MADPRDNFPDPGIPNALADSLRAAYRWPDRPVSTLDDAVLALARERAALIRRRRATVRFLGRAAAVATAAGLALAAVVIPQWGAQRGSAPLVLAPARPSIAGDVNGDGGVNILDALALARRIDLPDSTAASGTPANADLNGDGAVDLKDVDAIAQASVRLEVRG
jgi:hypothetical protein